MTKQVNYIGNGTQNEQFDGVVDVVIHMDDAEKFVYEYEGKRYLKIQVSQRKKADQFGHTHTVSHFTPKSKLDAAAEAYNELVANPRTRAVLDERAAAAKAKRSKKK